MDKKIIRKIKYIIRVHVAKMVFSGTYEEFLRHKEELRKNYLP